MSENTEREELKKWFDPKTRQLATNNYHFAAGWYDDPWGATPDTERFWSGRNWSTETRQK